MVLEFEPFGVQLSDAHVFRRFGVEPMLKRVAVRLTGKLM
jgi:hypothetical protein